MLLPMRSRKSTSDLTAECQSTGTAASSCSVSTALCGGETTKQQRNASVRRKQQQQQQQSYNGSSRRGSAKVGLAYLASRRNSRDSTKITASNSSIFSNDEIGPLTFQSSQRGQQRRTSNFLELPSKRHTVDKDDCTEEFRYFCFCCSSQSYSTSCVFIA